VTPRDPDSLTRLDEAFPPQPLPGHTTHEGLVVVQQQVTRMVRASLWRWIVSAIVALPATAGAAYTAWTIATGVGEVRAQQRQVRDDVALVLTAVQKLSLEGETTRARLDEGARADTELRAAIKAIDDRQWSERRAVAVERPQRR